MESSAEKKAVKPPVYKYYSPVRDIVIICVCILGMAGSAWFFYQDIQSSGQRLNEKPVGVVYWADNSVKRLSSHRSQPERLERYTSVYDRDTISSAAFSDVRINFINGESLELSENTSVRINYRNEEIPSFDLLGGEIEVQSSQINMAVSVPENASDTGPANYKYMVNLDPKTSMGINSSDNLTVKVYQGSGTVTSAGKYNNIAAGQILKADSNGFITPDSQILMLSPRTGTRLFRTSEGKEPVKFEWQRAAAQNTGGVTMEISQSKDFSSLTEKWDWQNTGASELQLDPGTYYWKIFDPASPENFDSGRLDIVQTFAASALFPADGAVINLSPGKQDIRFSWTVPEQAEAVLLEVANNSDMSNPSVRQFIKRTSYGRGTYNCSELSMGQWYWRIQPVYPGNDVQATTGNPPVVNMFVLQPSAGQPVPASSTPAPVADTSGILRPIFPPDDYTLESNRTPDLIFTWKRPASRSNRFQIARIPDFSSSMIVNAEVIGSNYQCPYLQPGYYYWRILGDTTENSSHPSRLVVLPGLPGPALETPTQNEVLHVEEGTPVKFSWEQVNYANYFIFSLYLIGRDQPLREVSSILNNSVMVYFDPKTAGRFRWTVQGIISPTEFTSGRNGLIAQGNFSVNPGTIPAQGSQITWRIPRIANMQSYYGEVDSPIKLLSPASGVNVPGIQALRTPPLARWTSDERLQNIQLIVSRTTDPSSDPRAVIKDVSGTSADFPSLGEGIWYWIIRGDAEELRGATPADPFWFNVYPVPLLPSPRASQPLDSSVIDLAQLTRDRNITFLWDKVDGANTYIFSFYRNEKTPVLLLASSPQEDASYTFNDLSKLSDGDYFWQAEAVYTNEIGVIDQRGLIVRHPFTIQIQHSSDIQTHSQGTMYGQ